MICESKSVPPIETRLPSIYLSLNLPSLSEVVENSEESQRKLEFSSIQTSAPDTVSYTHLRAHET